MYLLDEESALERADSLGQVGNFGLVDIAVQVADRLEEILCDVLVEIRRLRGKGHECDRNLLLRPPNPGNDLVAVGAAMVVRVPLGVVELAELEPVEWVQLYDVQKAVVMMRLEGRIRTTVIEH